MDCDPCESAARPICAVTRTCGACEARGCRFSVYCEAPGRERRVWCTRALGGRSERKLQAQMLDDRACNVCEYNDVPVLRITLGDSGACAIMCTSCINETDLALAARLPCFADSDGACTLAHTLLLPSKALNVMAQAEPAARVCGAPPAGRAYVPSEHWRCLMLGGNETLDELRARFEPVASINTISEQMACMSIRAFCVRLDQQASL